MTFSTLSPTSPRRIQRPTSGGFTLVEVLLSMVLTVVLMMGLMMVASSSMQDRRRLAERQQAIEPVWLEPVARQIETDLLMGSGISGLVPPEHPNSFENGTRIYILTQAPQGGGSGAEGLPALVSYRLVPSDQGGILLREQRPLTRPQGVAGTTSQQPSVQVVAAGVEAVQIAGTTLSVSDAARHPPVTHARANSAFMILVDHQPVAMQPVPEQVPLVITSDGTSQRDDREGNRQQQTLRRTLLTR